MTEKWTVQIIRMHWFAGSSWSGLVTEAITTVASRLKVKLPAYYLFHENAVREITCFGVGGVEFGSDLYSQWDMIVISGVYREVIFYLSMWQMIIISGV